MVIRIVLTVVFIILVLIAYFLFVPIIFNASGDFDQKYFKVMLHDPLRFINLRYDTGREDKFLLRIFYFIKIGGSSDKNKKDEKGKKKKARDKTEKKTNKKSGKKNRLVEFVKKKAKIIIKSIFSFLKKCRIHISDCDISFSTGEPDSSALLYGGISALPFMYGRHTKVDVDLMSDDAFIRGHIKVSGSIFIIILLYYVLRILVSKGE